MCHNSHKGHEHISMTTACVQFFRGTEDLYQRKTSLKAAFTADFQYLAPFCETDVSDISTLPTAYPLVNA